MSTTHGDDGVGSTSISVKVDDEFLEEFDLALKRAQVEGDVEMDVSRSEAIRRLMHVAAEDMSVLEDTTE